MGMLTSQPMLDPENVGHILLGTSAFLSSCYVIIYRMFIFGEKLDWLSRFWLAYTMTQSIKCVTTVETNIAYGYDFGYTLWPDGIRFFNMLLTCVVSFENLCLWTTLLFKSGPNYNEEKSINRYHLVLKLLLASFVVELLVTCILYVAYGNFGFSPVAYTIPISVFYMLAFWIPSWSAVGYTIRCASKQYLVPIDGKHDNKVTRRFLIVTLCAMVVGILVGAWSGTKTTNGRIGKAFLGLFYLIPTTAMVHYLERFENFKNLMWKKPPMEFEVDEEAGNNEKETANGRED